MPKPTRFLIVRKIGNNYQFVPTSSELLSKKTYYHNLIATQEGVLPFKPDFGIKSDFINLDEFKTYLEAKFGAKGISVELIEDNNEKILVVRLSGTIIAIVR